MILIPMPPRLTPARCKSAMTAPPHNCQRCRQQWDAGFQSLRQRFVRRSISGSGAVQQIRLGTVILTNTNTCTNGTSISAGTLPLGNGSTTGSIASDVTDNSMLTFNRSDALTFPRTITGSGALQQNGTGTTILTSNSAYSGGTIVDAAAFQLSNGGTTGSIAGDVTDNHVLTFNRSDALTFAGAITGSARSPANGTGTSILTSNSPYSGGSIVNAGTLQLGNGSAGGSVPGNVSDNGSSRSSAPIPTVSTAPFPEAARSPDRSRHDHPRPPANSYSGAPPSMPACSRWRPTPISAPPRAASLSAAGRCNSSRLHHRPRGHAQRRRRRIDTNGNTTTLAGIVGGSGGRLARSLPRPYAHRRHTYSGGTTLAAGTCGSRRFTLGTGALTTTGSVMD